MKFYSFFFAKSLSIFFLLLGMLTLVSVIMIPILYEQTLLSDAKGKSMLNINNVDLWATSPGKLNSTLKNKFRFFNLDRMDGTSEILLTLKNESIILNEQIGYHNFSFSSKSDQVEFQSDSLSTIDNDNSNNDFVIDHLDQGLLELLTTLTNPPQYQLGLNSLFILFNKDFGSSKEFINKLFTVFAYNYVIKNKEQVLNTILKVLPVEKRSIIYDSDINYSIGFIKGFFEWVQLIGDEGKINSYKWPKDKFSLNNDDLDSIVGKKSYLFSLYIWFNNDLSFNFNCASKQFCSNELIFQQLIDNSVTNFFNIENLKQLNDLINPVLNQYEKSPEFIYFYEQEYANSTNNLYINFTQEYLEEIAFNRDQLEQIFLNRNTTLLDTSNILDLLFYEKTQDLYKSYSKFKIKSKKQLTFIRNYIFKYLNELYNFPTVEVYDEKKLRLNFLSTTFTSLLQTAVNSTYSLIPKNIKIILISKILENKFTIISSEKGVCNDIVSPAVNNDVNRTSKICSMPELNMKTYYSIKNWVLPYQCIYFSNCRDEEKNYVKTLSGLSQEEFAIVYKQPNLGKYIEEAVNLIKTLYKCGECNEEYLAKIQWISSTITKTAFPNINSTSLTLYEWDNQEFSYPVELFYYLINNGCSIDDCNKTNRGIVFSLLKTKTDAYSLNNKEEFNDRFNIQKAHSLYINGYTTSPIFEKLMITNPANYFSALKYFLSSIIFSKRLKARYNTPLAFITGNSLENNSFLQILRSGNFYENFRPELETTTGFHVNLKNSTTQPLKFDTYSVDTGFIENEYNVRRIKKINDYSVMNTYSRLYSPVNLNYFQKNIPLYNSKFFNNTFDISDGFQYSADKKIIYYFDHLTSRILEFEYSSLKDIKGNLHCKLYTLNYNISLNLNENLNYENLDKYSELGTMFNKFNKPYIISKTNLFDIPENNITWAFAKVTAYKNIEDSINNNFICVDYFSDMVLQSNITLMFSVYTGKFNELSTEFPENAIIPLFIYERTYSIDVNAYNNFYPGLNNFPITKLSILVIGLIVTLIFLILSICLCVRYRNAKSILMDNRRLVSN